MDINGLLPGKVLVIGGSGFVGSAIVHRLAARGVNVRVPTRRYEAAKALTLPIAVELLEADVHNPATLERLMQGCDAVINLVGILHSRSGEPWGPDFARAHVELPQKIVAACRSASVRRLVHMSALGAAADGPSQYLRSKAAGEAAVMAAKGEMAVTVFRPSVIFGPDDRFVNLFARLLRVAPVLPLAGGDARFQPVYVGDVAQAFIASLDDASSFGRAYDLGGPGVYTLSELVAVIGNAIGCRRLVVPLPEGLAMLQAAIMEKLPVKLMSRDNVCSMRKPNVCPEGTLFPFGIHPLPLEAALPRWLGPAAKAERFNRYRANH